MHVESIVLFFLVLFLDYMNDGVRADIPLAIQAFKRNLSSLIEAIMAQIGQNMAKKTRVCTE